MFFKKSYLSIKIMSFLTRDFISQLFHLKFILKQKNQKYSIYVYH